MILFFIGLFFLLFGYGLLIGNGMVDILPPFVGYLLFYFGSRKVTVYSSKFLKIRYAAPVFAVVSLGLWIKDIIFYPLDGSVLETIWNLVVTALSLLLLLWMFQGFADMSARLRLPDTAGMMRTYRIIWVILVVCDIGVYIFQSLTPVAYTLLFGGYMAALSYLIYSYRPQKILHEAWKRRCMQLYGER